MPRFPQKVAIKIIGNLKNLIVFDILYIGVAKDANADKATIMIKMLLVKAASTAAWPITIPPTMPKVCPIFVGNLAPASRRNSIVISKKSTSRTGGKGTLFLEKMRGPNKSFGIIS